MPFQRIPGLVSVVIPTYNQGHYVARCLEHIERQTYLSVEVIVIDDDSTDDTEQNVTLRSDTFIDQPARSLRYVRLPRHVGYAGALTTGMFLTKGEFIAIQDMDDLSAATRLERQVRYLEANADVDVLGTAFERFEPDTEAQEERTDWIEFGADTINQSYALGRPAVCMSTVMLRGVVFDYVGGLSRVPAGLADHQFIAKCIAHGAGVDNLREVLYFASEKAGVYR